VGSEVQCLDLYSKGRERPKTQEILPYYEELVSEFFPAKLIGDRLAVL